MTILRRGVGRSPATPNPKRWHRALIAGITTVTVGWFVGSALPAEAQVRSAVGTSVQFSCSDSEATIRQKRGPAVSIGTSRIYVGYQQVSSNNKNPVMARFDGNGRRVWCRNNYEVSGDDGEGYGVLWNGRSILYGVFSATGTQGSSDQDYRRFTSQGWLSSYGSGGGPRAAVILRINPNTGQPTQGTFLASTLNDGRTNSLLVRNLGWTGTNLVVTSDAWYSPRRANRRPYTCQGSSPFRYRAWFSPDLRQATRTEVTGCQ